MIRNKRVIWRSMWVAARDEIENGPARRSDKITVARVSGTCRACGIPYDVGTTIQLSADDDPRGQNWYHAQCPDAWLTACQLVESHDPLMIIKENPVMRQGTCKACEHSFSGQRGWLVRLFRPLGVGEGDHSVWICDDCKKIPENQVAK